MVSGTACNGGRILRDGSGDYCSYPIGTGPGTGKDKDSSLRSLGGTREPPRYLSQTCVL